MRPAYKQRVREFVKGGRAALVNRSLDGGLCLKDIRCRPSVDPNCELFPQGPIIPVPPSTPPYRPVGICGNNWAVSPYRDAKRKPPNQRVRRLLFPLFPLDGFSSAVPSFQLRPVFGAVSNRVPSGNAMSCFIAFGDKSRDNLKNFFRTQGFEFCPKVRIGAPLEARWR